MNKNEAMDRFIKHMADMIEKYGDMVLEEVEDCAIMTLRESELHE